MAQEIRESDAPNNILVTSDVQVAPLSPELRIPIATAGPTRVHSYCNAVSNAAFVCRPHTGAGLGSL